MATAAAKKATDTGSAPVAVAPIAATRISTGTSPLRRLPSRIGRSASGSTPRSRSMLRQRRRAALQHDDVAELQPDRARPLAEPRAAAADREQVEPEAVEERQPLRRPADQARVGADHAFDRHRRLALLGRLATAGDAEPRARDQAVERGMVALDEERCRPRAGRRRAAA